MTRILITGSRYWQDRTSIAEALTQAWNDHGRPDEVTVVHGECPYGGADIIAAEIATERGWSVDPHPADWGGLGSEAGPERNQEMVDLGADIALAFPEEGSRGTWDCVRKARDAGIPVTVWGEDKQ